MKVLGNKSSGLAFVVSAPAGTGKTTLVQMLMEEFSSVRESISLTTRAPRKNEKEGEHYHFIDDAEFAKRRESGEFLECAQVYENWYGTSRRHIQEQLASGKHVVLVIDTQGALQLMGDFPATFIFVSPPSMGELRRRLERRSTESVESVEQRLAWAEKEMALSERYDYHIVNGDLATAYQVLRGILIAEEHRVRTQD